jgi:hypothetical protein
MEPLESGVIDHIFLIFNLMTTIVIFYAKFREKLCRLFKETDIYLEKYIK